MADTVDDLKNQITAIVKKIADLEEEMKTASVEDKPSIRGHLTALIGEKTALMNRLPPIQPPPSGKPQSHPPPARVLSLFCCPCLSLPLCVCVLSEELALLEGLGEGTLSQLAFLHPETCYTLLPVSLFVEEQA